MRWFCLVVVLLIIISLIKIKLLVCLKSGFGCSFFLKILFFKFLIFPKKDKKKNKKQTVQSKTFEGENGQKSSKKTRKKFNLQSFSEKSELFFLILEPTFNMLKFLNRGFKIKKFNLNLQIVGDDACNTAVSYGRFCWLFGSLFKFLSSVCRVEVERFRVVPVFVAETFSYNFSCCMQIGVGRLFIGFLKYIFIVAIKILLNKMKKAKGSG